MKDNLHTDNLIHVEDLSISFKTFAGPVNIVRHTSLTLKAGEILGLVGESGSGKSITVGALLGLYTGTSAQVTCQQLDILGQDCRDYREEDWRALRGSRVAMIFQDPMTALNPILTIGSQIREALPAHKNTKERAIELLKQVGLTDPERRVDQYPHELSGGMRQRVVIAMALAGEPDIIIADEPTTALDVTTEAQILVTLQKLIRQEGLGMIFISHNLRVVSQLCDRVMVMYGGQWVEDGSVDAIFYAPQHPYTKALLAALPQGKQRGQLESIPGQPPDVAHRPSGCAFHPRCGQAMQVCQAMEAPIEEVDVHQEQRIRCWLPAAERSLTHDGQ